MSLPNELGQESGDFARKFLQTAVVVDDEALMPRVEGDPPRSGLRPPDRHRQSSNSEGQVRIDRASLRSLDARSVMNAFLDHGVICGVVGPSDSVKEAVRQADIVILDWRLRDCDPDYTLELVRELVTRESDKNSLRLVAIYTGEAGLEEISEKISNVLQSAGLEPKADELNASISYRHGRVVLYAKSDVLLNPRLRDRSVSEDLLPDRLVKDFEQMTSGLLPSLALTSLTAVREGAHKVLDRFGADLDPAFLTHRACLTDPDDAEHQIVNHIAEELRGLIDNAVAEMSPANPNAVKQWLQCKHANTGSSKFKFDDRELSLNETIQLANEGLKASVLPKKAIDHLTAGFSGNGGVELDMRLAWIMSFRTVYTAPSPYLWLGTVLSKLSGGSEQYMICFRPRCDSVRLNEKTSFYFLPLVDSHKESEQIVLNLDGTFVRFGIYLDPAGWIHLQFKPDSNVSPVRAKKRDSDGGFEFTDVCGIQYTWIGELKPDYAQRIAQSLAATLSRVAIDESEWLRNQARK